MACYLHVSTSMRVILTFYKNFSWLVLAISLLGCWLIWLYGSWQYMIVVFWTKVLTNTLLGLFIHIFSPSQFYFFKNLGYSKTRLYTYTFIFDMVIWFIMSWLTIRMLT